MTDTLDALEQAIQAHVAATSETKVFCEHWIVTVYVVSLDGDEIQPYGLITPATQPLHIDVGLAHAAGKFTDASYDYILDTDTDDD